MQCDSVILTSKAGYSDLSMVMVKSTDAPASVYTEAELAEGDERQESVFNNA